VAISRHYLAPGDTDRSTGPSRKRLAVKKYVLARRYAWTLLKFQEDKLD
jgi:hypothetical protein